MDTQEESSQNGPYSWDIARLDKSEGAAGRAAWTETYAARALGFALTAQPEFWEQVAFIRACEIDFGTVAARYAPRHGPRRVAVGQYLRRAVAVPPRPSSSDPEAAAKVAVWNTGLRAWACDAAAAPDAPARALRSDAEATIAVGAFMVARRGAGRCAHPDCCTDADGRKAGALLYFTDGPYCSVCTDRSGRPGGPRPVDVLVDVERSVMDAVIAAVVVHQPSRPRSRRVRRQ